MKTSFQRRVQRVKSKLKLEDQPAGLLISSAPPASRSSDVEFPYRQSSDFYYLTGSNAKEWLLLISPVRQKPVLFVPPVDERRILWEGAAPDGRSLARKLGAELIVYRNLTSELLPRLEGVRKLYFNNVPGSLARHAALQLIDRNYRARRTLPVTFADSELLLEPLRSFKDAEEIRQIRAAAAVTNSALFQALPLVQPGMNERQIAATVDYVFAMEGCVPAFTTIVAAGASAATLHHSSSTRRLRRGDLLLIDCGAECDMYAADITRVIPVAGDFLPWQQELYEVVLAAQEAAIRKARPGVSSRAVYQAAARVLTEGLVDLGVLRGKVSSLLARRAYRPYFPHGIGHELGLDVHDSERLRAGQEVVLERGMVLTIEPGLYFRKATRALPACGVRIEDDILVGHDKATILSAGFPKKVSELRAILA